MTATRPARHIPASVLVLLACLVGCVGGIYGIGGGAILAPILFTILSLHQHVSVAADWPTGLALGLGGLAGGYTGARLQSRLPDVLIRRLVGVLVIAIGAYYLSSGLG